MGTPKGPCGLELASTGPLARDFGRKRSHSGFTFCRANEARHLVGLRGESNTPLPPWPRAGLGDIHVLLAFEAHFG
jgi:hypothetical protein